MAGGVVANSLNTDFGVFQNNNAYNAIPKAWVNYVGSSGAISKSFNVSSVTYNSTGSWTVNFASALSDSNYVTVIGSGTYGTSTAGGISYAPSSQTTSSCGIGFAVGTSGYNPPNMYVAFFD